MLKTNEKYKHLYQYVCQATPSIINTDDYPMTMKIYWILNDFTDFPKCPVCGKILLTKNYSVFAGYVKTCSKVCARLLAKRTNVKTCLDRYGLTNGGGSP